MSYPVVKRRTVLCALFALIGGFWIALKALEALEQNFLKPTESAQTSEQHLPVSFQIKVKNDVIELELAQPPQEQEIGLMNRGQISPSRGMLFLIDPPRNVQIWMRGMKVPLDLVFLRKGTIKAIKPSVAPCKTKSCPTYESGTEVDRVIELTAGRTKELGLKVGDRLDCVTSTVSSVPLTVSTVPLAAFLTSSTTHSTGRDADSGD